MAGYHEQAVWANRFLAGIWRAAWSSEDWQSKADSPIACLLRVGQLAAAEGVKLRQRRRAGTPVHVRGEQVLPRHWVAARVRLLMRAVPFSDVKIGSKLTVALRCLRMTNTSPCSRLTLQANDRVHLLWRWRLHMPSAWSASAHSRCFGYYA